MAAEEFRLNAEWKAVLDKAEADRTGQYERLRERIRKMQRAYESNAGKEDQEREEAEEARRNMWVEKEDLRLKEEDRRKKEKRKQMVADTTAFNLTLLQHQEAARKKERSDEEEYGRRVRADVKVEEQREKEKSALRRARALQQQHHLNEQIVEQKKQLARDPGASEMTALEASLNRGLLVSIVQHKYPDPHVLN